MKGVVKLFVMDVDGTLTDGRINMGPDGELFKSFNIKDGYGINEMLPAHGIVPAIITGRTSQIVANRARELHITELYQGKHDKLDTLRALMAKYQCSRENVAYIGDDILDIVCMRECGVVGCPADACPEVKELAQFVSSLKGGEGAVREFVEYVIRHNSMH
jgi:3-deoxy-D-manno-octulosonate 8-phosphate phosphatase (KDO 8-P phosphatase)